MDQNCNHCKCNKGLNMNLGNKYACPMDDSPCQQYSNLENNKGCGRGCNRANDCAKDSNCGCKKSCRAENNRFYERVESDRGFGCGCEHKMAYRNEARNCEHLESDEISCMPIAMAYVPWQEWGEVFTGECGLENGTIFPELVKPFWVKCGLRM